MFVFGFLPIMILSYPPLFFLVSPFDVFLLSETVDKTRRDLRSREKETRGKIVFFSLRSLEVVGKTGS